MAATLPPPLLPFTEERTLPLSRRGDLVLTLEAEDENGQLTVWPDGTTGFIEFTVPGPSTMPGQPGPGVDTRHDATFDAGVLRYIVESEDLDPVPAKGATWRLVVQHAVYFGRDKVIFEGPIVRGKYG